VKIVPAVLWQQAEDAAVLWLGRDRAVGEPHYTLKDLSALDTRLDACLDGLEIASTIEPDIVWQAHGRDAEQGGTGDFFAAAILGLKSGNRSHFWTLLSAVRTNCELSRPLVSALGWLPWNCAEVFTIQLLQAEDAAWNWIGLAAAAAHRRDPGSALAKALNISDKSVLACALRSVGELARRDLLPAVHEHLCDTSGRCCLAASWSVALMAQDDRAFVNLRTWVQARKNGWERALELILRRMGASDGKNWIGQLANDTDWLRPAVSGAGALGDAELVPWLCEHMSEPALSRVAGEAFSMITGVDLAGQDLEGEWPEGFEAGPNDDPADGNVEMDPDENLPWPDVAKVKDWWMRHRHEFQPGVRYLCGRPMTEEWLEHVLRYGYQRQRAAAALELAIRRPGTPLFNVKAPGYRQQQLLGLR
jgi:uncharacterized protein (TIGR02270 family)